MAKFLFVTISDSINDIYCLTTRKNIHEIRSDFHDYKWLLVTLKSISLAPDGVVLNLPGQVVSSTQ